MANDFNSVEAELRAIDDDFLAGRMNAFGTHAAQDEIFRELRKITELESQVFFRTSEQIGAAIDEENALQRTFNEQVALLKPSEGPSSASASGPPRHGHSASMSGSQQPPTPDEGSTRSATVSAPIASDRSFEEVSKLFARMEESHRAVANNLRQMSKHVEGVHDMVNRLHQPMQ